MSKFVWMKKPKPPGWELLEPTLQEFDAKMRDVVNDPHDGKRRCELNWGIHRTHFQKNRFIYDMFYKKKEISKELYQFCLDNKIADPALHSKWKKPGYETLCSLSAIRAGDHNFGTTSVCRVPLAKRHDKIAPSIATGCISCASGDGGPIWWDELDRALEVAAQGKTKKRARAAAEEQEVEHDPDFEARLKQLKGN